MSETERPWIVTPHGPLERLDENLWAVQGQVPTLPGVNRRMAIVRRSDGTLAFFNAIPLEEPVLAEVLALGRPAALLLPNAFHQLDAPAFRSRLGLTAYGPPEGLEAIRERLPCEPIAALPPDPALRVEGVAGFSTGELVAEVRSGERASLLLADLVTNVRHLRSLPGLFMRLVGFTGPAPTLPPPVQRRVLRDRAAVRAQLERLAAIPGLARLVVSHGLVHEGDAAGALRRIAEAL